jgi:hypothetical protein
MKALILTLNQKNLIFFCLGIFIVFCVFIKFSDFESVFAQYSPVIHGTTANVSVSGYLGFINVTYLPVNFTAGVGRNPGTIVAKANIQPYLTIDMTDQTNIAWDAYMNATNLIPVNGVGTPIVPSRITVWSTCDGGVALPGTSLGNNLIKLCEDITYNRNFDLYFNLSIPVGQYNNTYYGNLTIYVNSSDASPGDGSNRTWFGPNNTTVKVIQHIEFWWNAATTPINFATLSPGIGFCSGMPLVCYPSANATGPSAGFPANMTVGDNTNIYTDIYIKGNDLIGLSGMALGPPRFDILVGIPPARGNLTYSNATSSANWPATIKFVNYSFQAPGPSYQGDFANWHHVKNYTDVPSFWNISVPNEAKQGSYGGDITAKAVDEGEKP